MAEEGAADVGDVILCNSDVWKGPKNPFHFGPGSRHNAFAHHQNPDRRRTIRGEHGHRRGFFQSGFTEVWERYLPDPKPHSNQEKLVSMSQFSIRRHSP